MSKGKDDAPHELESQFVLRLPPVRARPGPQPVTPSSAVGKLRVWEGMWKQAGCFGACLAHSHPFERVFHGLPWRGALATQSRRLKGILEGLGGPFCKGRDLTMLAL